VVSLSNHAWACRAFHISFTLRQAQGERHGFIAGQSIEKNALKAPVKQHHSRSDLIGEAGEPGIDGYDIDKADLYAACS
jgi:hypothetical protein